MSYRDRVRAILGMSITFVLGIGDLSFAQSGAATNSAPNPYRSIDDWAKMPEGRTWGSTSGVDIDPDGTSVCTIRFLPGWATKSNGLPLMAPWAHLCEMGTKSRETIYGSSVRAAAEQARAARKKADRLACQAWNKRMLGLQGPAQPSPTTRRSGSMAGSAGAASTTT
jgi:hypothetical protein